VTIEMSPYSMSETTVTPRHAWQPFTPRGAAAFAEAPLGRLMLVQMVVAAFAAATVVWFVQANWFPVAREALGRLPAGAAIRGGRLVWTTNTPVRLAESRLLALTVDAQNKGSLGRTADLEVRLHDTHLDLASWLGHVELDYPHGWTVFLSPAEVIPWWGAWAGPLLGGLAAAVALGLMASWLVLATLYCPVTLAFTFFADRRAGLGGSWKVSGAALMPGAVLLMLGLFCYGWLGMDLLRLGLFFLLHFVAGWIYIVTSPFFLSRHPAAPGLSDDPFGPLDDPGPRPKRAPANPFAGPGPAGPD
jgi:hypothetical protein